jgi:protein involved in polysaccharide export with SLBB domain
VEHRLPSIPAIIFVCVFTLSAYPQAGSVTAANEAQLAHAGDIVDVDFIGSSEYDWRGEVDLSGVLSSFPTYGEPIRAGCKSEQDLASEIALAYSKMLREPKVAVRIVDSSRRAPITITGSILRPARYQAKRGVRLREIIVRSGGFTDDASGEITVLRPSPNCLSGGKDNGPHTIRIKISELLKGSQEADLAMISGDIIEVERSVPVYVIGAVNNPRPVTSRPDMTVSRAIASAGGLTDGARGGKATIFRREGVETSVVEVDLAKIKADETSDILVKPFDIIDVAGPAAAKRKFPPALPDTGGKSADIRQLPLRVID